MIFWSFVLLAVQLSRLEAKSSHSANHTRLPAQQDRQPNSRPPPRLVNTPEIRQLQQIYLEDRNQSTSYWGHDDRESRRYDSDRDHHGPRHRNGRRGRQNNPFRVHQHRSDS